MDPRLAAAPVVTRFALQVRPVVAAVGVYAGGSMASRDYVPATSDFDLVAVVRRELDAGQRAALTQLHRQLLREDPGAARLHCAYPAQDQLADVHRPHPTWAHGELFERVVTDLARAELLHGGITVLGPDPATLLAPVGPDALRTAAREELTGYWAGALRTRRRWLLDVYADLGLLTLARAEVTLREGRLVTKTEAVGRLGALGVPPELVAQLVQRRRGEPVPLSLPARLRRARTVRRLMAEGIDRLAAAAPPTAPG